MLLLRDDVVFLIPGSARIRSPDLPIRNRCLHSRPQLWSCLGDQVRASTPDAGDRLLTFSGHAHPQTLVVAAIPAVVAYARIDGAVSGSFADVAAVLFQPSAEKFLQTKRESSESGLVGWSVRLFLMQMEVDWDGWGGGGGGRGGRGDEQCSGRIVVRMCLCVRTLRPTDVLRSTSNMTRSQYKRWQNGAGGVGRENFFPNSSCGSLQEGH